MFIVDEKGTAVRRFAEPDEPEECTGSDDCYCWDCILELEDKQQDLELEQLKQDLQNQLWLRNIFFGLVVLAWVSFTIALVVLG